MYVELCWGGSFYWVVEMSITWVCRWPVCTIAIKIKMEYTGTMTTAKMNILLGYNMEIVIMGVTKLCWGNKNLLKKESLLGITFPGRVWAKFWLVGEHPSYLPKRGLPSVAKTLMDVVKHAQSHSKQQICYISKMCLFFAHG